MRWSRASSRSPTTPKAGACSRAPTWCCRTTPRPRRPTSASTSSRPTTRTCLPTGRMSPPPFAAPWPARPKRWPGARSMQRPPTPRPWRSQARAPISETISQARPRSGSASWRRFPRATMWPGACAQASMKRARRLAWRRLPTARVPRLPPRLRRSRCRVGWRSMPRSARSLRRTTPYSSSCVARRAVRRWPRCASRAANCRSTSASTVPP